MFEVNIVKCKQLIDHIGDFPREKVKRKTRSSEGWVLVAAVIVFSEFGAVVRVCVCVAGGAVVRWVGGRERSGERRRRRR